MSWNKQKLERANQIIAKCQLLDTNIETKRKRDIDIDNFVRKQYRNWAMIKVKRFRILQKRVEKIREEKYLEQILFNLENI